MGESATRKRARAEGHKLFIQHQRVIDGKLMFVDGCSFYNCRLIDCMFIWKGGQFYFNEDCQFINCRWHLDTVISDPKVWAEFMELAAPMIQDSLPRQPVKEVVKPGPKIPGSEIDHSRN